MLSADTKSIDIELLRFLKTCRACNVRDAHGASLRRAVFFTINDYFLSNEPKLIVYFIWIFIFSINRLFCRYNPGSNQCKNVNRALFAVVILLFAKVRGVFLS